MSELSRQVMESEPDELEQVIDAVIKRLAQYHQEKNPECETPRRCVSSTLARNIVSEVAQSYPEAMGLLEKQKLNLYFQSLQEDNE